MIDAGADTLFVYANQVGLGSIQAAKEKGAKFIGFSANQNDVAPGTVVASVPFDFEKFYTWTIDMFLKGELEGNMVHEAGIAEGLFSPVYTDQISQEVQDKVKAGMDAATKGEVDFESMFAQQ
jgi:basic membrane protein A